MTRAFAAPAWLARLSPSTFAVVTLAAALIGLQYPLWFGEGSVPKVIRLEREIRAQRVENARLRERNAALDAEVKDLKRGRGAIEDRARAELGMVKPDETFYQIVDAPPPAGRASRK